MRTRQLIAFGRPYRWQLLALVVLTTASSLVLLVIPWLAGRALGGIIGGGEGAQLRTFALLAACLVAIAILNFVTADRVAHTGSRVLADLRERIYDHVQRLPMASHDGRSKGDTLALMTFEIHRLSIFLTATLVTTPSRLLVALGAVVVMFRIDARLALLVPIVIPGFYLVMRFLGKHLHQLGVQLQQAQARTVSLAEEALEIIPATKAFSRETQQFDRYHAAVRDVERYSIREGRTYAVLEPAIALLASLAALTILWFAGKGVEAGRMSAGELFSFMLYAALLTRPIASLAQLYGQVQGARGTLARLQSVLDEPTEDIPVAVPAQVGPGTIEFIDLHFGYPGRERVLRGLNLAISAGETVALVGPNGAGKTALINLLMRYYAPQSGTIRIGGEDWSGISLPDLRGRIGLVPQSAFLFNGSIRDNIAFGAVDPTPGEVEGAARLAQAADFIATLPQGMETLIGDRGLKLSGGQRQRISLARALIKDPPILIFDEATSMFDEDGERAFIAACADALKDRTVIIVTHRPAILELADRVVYLVDGQIQDRSDRAGRRNLATA